MMQGQINNGDVVQLKSGGPLMTVTDDADEKAIEVTWFDDKKALQYGAFPTHVLKVREDRMEMA